jgi:hypothetical protein
LSDLPEKALSIRQPWAWAILNAGKNIENRPRRFHYRGPICLHASLYKDVKGDEWDRCMAVLDDIHGAFTMRELASQQGRWSSASTSDEAVRGGIIGTAEIVDCVDHSDSPWFSGPYGLVLRNIKPVPFVPVKGALGLFNWRKNLCVEAIKYPIS